MDVKVRHRFASVAAVVNDDPVSRFRQPERLRDLPRGQQHISQQGRVFFRRGTEARDDALRHDESLGLILEELSQGEINGEDYDINWPTRAKTTIW